MKRFATISILVVFGLALGVVLLLLSHQRPIRYTTVRADIEPIAPEMVEITAGPFLMGNRDGTPFEKPVHQVDLSTYSMGRYEVTNQEYRRFADATGRAYPADPIFARGQNYFLSHPRHPVVEISWTDAAAYCQWLSDRTGKRYHLPTEAQWEKAARGGLDQALYPWGDERRENAARMNLSWSAGPVEVGSYPPNGYGLFDVAGNVNEMTADWYDEYWYRRSPERDPQGPSGLANYLTLIDPPQRSRFKGRCKVVRGGSYRASWDWETPNPDGMLEIPVNVGARDYLYQEPYTHFDLGFRVVSEPAAEPR